MIYETNSLYHHGVKGMKWGIRHDTENSSKKSNASKVKRKKKLASASKAKSFVEKLQTKRIEKVIAANERDVASLKKYGYNEEAQAVKTVGDRYRKKLETLAKK